MKNTTLTMLKKISLTGALIIMLTIVCSGYSPPAHARVYLELDSPNLRRIPLAVAPLQPLCGASENKEVARSGRRILIDDLEFSTFFEIMQDTQPTLKNQRAAVSLREPLITVTGL